MGTLIAEVAALGLAVAFTSPVSVVTVIVLLNLPAGLRRGIAFLIGWLIALLVIAALMLFVLHGQDFGSRSSTPSRAASALEVLLGSLLLIWAVVAYRRRQPASEARRRPSGSTALPGRTGCSPSRLERSCSATGSRWPRRARSSRNVSRLDAGVAIGVFAVTSMITVAAPIVAVVAAPERSEQRLATWKAWLLGNSRTVVLVVLMVVAAFLIVRGVHDLAT